MTIDFDKGDDLSDMLGGTAPVAPRQLPQDEGLARIRATIPEIVETCPKCRGTGTFMSYSGRPLGQCFACKGRGSKTFKNPAPVRAANREKAMDRKIRQIENRWDHFAGKSAEHKAMLEWMVAKGGSFEFAAKMHEAVGRFGDLTINQEAAVKRCMARDQERAAQRQQTAAQQQERVAGINVANIVDCFQRASEAGFKKRFTLRFDGVHFQADKRDPALIWVSASGYGSAKYGRIQGGVFKPGRDATDEVIAKIALISADPMAAAKAYAQVTSSCSVCGLELTNEESIEEGMGPICAGRLRRPGSKFVEVAPGSF